MTYTDVFAVVQSPERSSLAVIVRSYFAVIEGYNSDPSTCVALSVHSLQIR